MTYILASGCGFLVGFAVAAFLAAAGRTSAYDEGMEDGIELAQYGPGATG